MNYSVTSRATTTYTIWVESTKTPKTALKKKEKNNRGDMTLAKLQSIEEELNQIFLDRVTLIRLGLIGLLINQHLFIVGPPGTGKTLLAKTLTERIEGARFFHTILGKTTMPEEVLGSADLQELQQGRFKRDTTNMLPEANVALIDEVGKGSSMIRNTMLELMNERMFTNGGVKQYAPLVTMFGCSNELLDKEEDAAFWDRFLLRCEVGQLEGASMKQLLMDKVNRNGFVASATTITLDELAKAQEEVAKIAIDEDMIEALVTIQKELIKEGFQVSTRKMTQVIAVLKADTYLAGDTTVGDDALISLAYCFWDSPKDIDVLRRIMSEQGDPIMKELGLILESAKEEVRRVYIDENTVKNFNQQQQEEYSINLGSACATLQDMVKKMDRITPKSKKSQKAIIIKEQVRSMIKETVEKRKELLELEMA
jgi:MoxR-like ATPase